MTSSPTTPIAERPEPERIYLFVQHLGRRLRDIDARAGLTPTRFSALASLRFHADGFGKPKLHQNESSFPLHFSLSHCRSIALLAVAAGRPVGVDVEEVRPIEAEVADSHFSASERVQLNQLQGDAWLLGFYRCWTRKEAILKAEGVGLSRPLDSFDVSLLPDETAELLGTRKHFSYPWTLHDLLPSDDTIGAVASAQLQTKLICFSFMNDSLS